MEELILDIPRPKEHWLQVICFPVGKADAFLLRTTYSAVLIDSGSCRTGKQLGKWLKQLGVGRLDYLISTHFDSDHIGGTEQVIKAVQVDDVIQSPYHKKNKAWKIYSSILKKNGLKPDQLHQVEEFMLDGIFYTVYPPEKEHYSEAESNNHSLMIRVQHQDISYLFMADAQEKRIQEWIDHYAEPCTWLKTPYHGRYQSILPEFLELASPQYAVITNSEKREDSPKTVDLLRKTGSQVTFTRDGLTVFESDGQNITKNYLQDTKVCAKITNEND